MGGEGEGAGGGVLGQNVATESPSVVCDCLLLSSRSLPIVGRLGVCRLS